MNITLLRNPELHTALSNYADFFYAATIKEEDTKNYVSSPLGSWLLLATLSASLRTDDSLKEKAELERILGMPLNSLKPFIVELLGLDGVESTVGAWFSERLTSGLPEVQAWLAKDDLTVHEQGIPTQEWLDEWTVRNTNGLIPKFPVDIDPDTAFLLANILYTKFDWQEPFEAVEATGSMSYWNVGNVLTESKVNGRVSTTEDGLIFSISKRAGENGQQVHSFVSEKDLTPQQLLAYGHKIAAGLVPTATSAEILECAKNSNILTVITTEGYGGNTYTVSLPAWEADSTHDLTEPILGYQNVTEVFALGMPPELLLEACVAQSAAARYGKVGFEAAAVTAYALMVRSAMPQLGQVLDINLSFNKPHAAICTVAGIPVFSAYIRKATEVAE
jgi:Serpin (serine protease inhibitor)